MSHFNDFNFKNKKAIVRVDLNVPLDKKTFSIGDDTRIRATLPTIHKILDDGGSVILMSHLGRPKKGYDIQFSLKHIVGRLSELLGKEVLFAEDCMGNVTKEKCAALRPGEVILLENLRFYEQETAGTESFAEQLASLADVYVNDAFGTAHRAHASTAVIAQFFPENKMVGNLIQKEIDSVSKVMNKGAKPVTAIIGGAKVSSKIAIIENLMDKVDNIIIGGGMTYTFIKAMEGNVGNSLVEEDYIALAKKTLNAAKEKGVRILLPEDSIVADTFSNDANTDEVATDSIPEGWMGLDIGKHAIRDYVECIKQSKTILWNGPMGVFEMEKFSRGTKEVAYAVAEATQSGAFSLIGGGDSVAAVNLFKLSDQVSHVSTGGGAMLEYLEGQELPGIVAVSKG